MTRAAGLRRQTQLFQLPRTLAPIQIRFSLQIHLLQLIQIQTLPPYFNTHGNKYKHIHRNCPANTATHTATVPANTSTLTACADKHKHLYRDSPDKHINAHRDSPDKHKHAYCDSPDKHINASVTVPTNTNTHTATVPTNKAHTAAHSATNTHTRTYTNTATRTHGHADKHPVPPTLTLYLYLHAYAHSDRNTGNSDFHSTPLPTETEKMEINNILVYPHPYSPDKGNLRIRFTITKKAHEISVKIYSASFRCVKDIKLFDAVQAGEYTAEIRSGKLKTFANGTYYFVLTDGG